MEADALSHCLLVKKQSMAAYTIKCDYQQVKSLIDTAAIQSNDEDGWIRLINTISAPCDEIGNEIIYKAKSKE